MLKITVLVLIWAAVEAKVALPARITFPKDHTFDNNCTLPNGQQGVCRKFMDCGTAVPERNEKPKTCYFEGAEQFVCCRVPRPSELACSEYYYPREEVINGLVTAPNEFPYMVALGWNTTKPNVYEYKCGAALISYDWVVTAAHCTSVGGQEPAVVLAGGVELTSTRFPPTPIENIIIHPKYEPKISYHDIALIKLTDAPHETEPACIGDHLPLISQNATAVGYGHTVFGGKPSDQLLKAYLQTIETVLCQFFFTDQDALPNGLLDTHLCAKDLQFNRDTCQGDSGGPLVLKGKAESFVIGVTSFGLGCATDAPGIYTNVAKYLDWIEPILWPHFTRKNEG
ncbi:serine protease snake-like isoform X1 [Bactrocera tryoni]|uniref:serine protease snake-like isoform X1 n=2 Tax=Bactrocera tryoni TaxID=59916 RepID=UPI001A9795A6|nr:serine protease snake-like isoform X1 [Bactrocera tryoni]